MTIAFDGLALLGGSPAFAEPLHVGRPNLGDRTRLMKRIEGVLDRNWLTNDGPLVRELEAEICTLVGVEHCVAMCNGTVALEIAIRALGLTGEVIVPSFTFVATAHALQWQEITPVFCDVLPDTHTLDPARVEELITPRTTGIIGVHLWGRACEVDELVAVAQRRQLSLIFDAAHSFGCSYHGRQIGNFGQAEVFSFHATKFFNTLEGGAVVTNDATLARTMRLMRNFGFDGYDQVIHVGTNGKMDEFSAAMGLTALESLPDVVSVNRRNLELYQRGMADLPGVRVLSHPEHEQSNYQYVVLEVDEAAAGLNRDQIVRFLHSENVLARRYFFPGAHKMEPYRSYFPHAGLLLPITERLVHEVMALPTGTAVGPSDIAGVCELIRVGLANAAALATHLDAAGG